MISAPIITAAVVLTFLPVFACGVLEKRGRIATLRGVAAIGIVAASYCVAAGIASLAGWGGPATIEPAW